MQIVKANNLACPLDGAPFGTYGKTVRCSNGHSFDEARQGYLHLLPVQYKRSKEPGDSAAMVSARSRFLDGGFYQPVSTRLNEIALNNLAADKEVCVVDAGCGEGYYLHHFCEALLAQEREAAASLIGIDIAKPAVQAAARRNRQITWLVAANRNPCVMPASVDLIFCMFGFPDYAAFARALKPGGALILVDAGSDHLLQLREVIYPEVRKSAPPSIDKAEACGFVQTDTQQLTYLSGEMGREQIADLLLMTPHLFRATHDGKEAVAALESLRVTVDVVFRLLQLGVTK